MEDDELAAIRARRMAEMGAAQGGGGARQQAEAAQRQMQQQAEAAERRNGMLQSIMDVSARERLHRIALVKPEKARQVEDMLLRAAQSGQLREVISEDRLVGMLKQFAEKEEAEGKPKIKIVRRSALSDD